MIYHITKAESWGDARRLGVYRAESLETQGYIHCSAANQVARVANAIFPGERGLILLHIDTNKLQSKVVYENLEGGAEMFPHVYGPIDVEAVVNVSTFEPTPDGDFSHHQLLLALSEFESIETERLRLRPFYLSDAPIVQELAGSRDIAKTVTNIPHPYEDGMAEQWIESTRDALACGRSLHLAITLKFEAHSGELAVTHGGRPESIDGGQGVDTYGGQRSEAHADHPTAEPLIGAVGLQFDTQNHAAELGYWVGVPYWNNGYGTEAARALVEYGFDTLGLNRIHACHMTNNPASGRIMQKIGMTYEGTQRQAARRFGSFEDLALYAILRSDYEPTRSRSPLT